MSRSLPALLSSALGVCILPFLILTNVFLVMTPNWLALQYAQPGFPKAERFSDADRFHFGGESIEYVAGNRTLAQFRALGVYEEREIKHMVDVRVLVDQVRVVWWLTGALIVIALIVLGRRAATQPLAARGLLTGALLTVALFALVGVFAAVGFQTFFTLFHRVFFEGDTWLFNYTDSLIQFYPLPFWFATSITLVLATLVEASIIGAVGYGWGKRQAKRG